MDRVHMNDRHGNDRTDGRAASRGAALATALHVVLLLVVLGETVFLASRYRVRVDATAEELFSLTDSTRAIVGGLDQRLVIEAYLSPKEDLRADLRQTRTVLDNFLDELVQLGRGRIVVQRFNPIDDKALQDKCMRIGIKPIDAQQQTTSAFGVQRHWQGLRLLYGDRQKVIEQIRPPSSFHAEAILTPALKEVTTRDKRVIGFMEWPSDPSPGQQQGRGWNVVRTMSQVASRYEFRNVRDAEGALLPDDVDTLLLFRPRDLTDREQYVLDQFLMRGGTIALFADAADYGIAPRRQFNKLPMTVDAKDGEYALKDQLLHYGVEWKPLVVADLAQEAHAARNMMTGQEYYGVPGQFGAVPYPYFFHTLPVDWAQLSDRVAQMVGGGDRENVDRLARRFRETLRPGIDTDEFLFKAFKQNGRGPVFYWPCWTDLRRAGGEPDLPAGVEGRVLLWSSPLALASDPPHNLDPRGAGDPLSQQQQLRKFIGDLTQRVLSEPRQQAPLMVDIAGTFPSFFAGKERPLRKSEKEAAEARAKAEAEAVEKGEDAEPADPAGAEPDDPPEPVIGPPAPGDREAADQAAAEPAPEAAKLEVPTAAGRLVVIGDSDFLRDDLVRGDYQQLGGPVSFTGRGFFQLFVDWLSSDSDLVALQSRVPVDRSLQLVEQELGSTTGTPVDPRVSAQRLARQTNLLVGLNVAVPCLILLLLGGTVFVVRRAQKRAFLQAAGS